MIRLYLIICAIITLGCKQGQVSEKMTHAPSLEPYFMVLGIAQDAGYPQIGCNKACCQPAWEDASKRQMVSSCAVVDPSSGKYWVLDASPDFKDQIAKVCNTMNVPLSVLPSGIFLTHAHIGHYTGLMHLGREAIGADSVPVYTMERMANYLSNSGPWSQLVALGNIALQPMQHDTAINITNDISITPFLVPHRGEYTETVGFKIASKAKSILFIPDIDKWHQWDRAIVQELSQVDAAFIDATFYRNGEIPNRDMSLIPHPFVEESMALFDTLPDVERNKIHFIHLNHTNPLIDSNSDAYDSVKKKGYMVAKEGQVVVLE